MEWESSFCRHHFIFGVHTDRTLQPANSGKSISLSHFLSFMRPFISCSAAIAFAGYGHRSQVSEWVHACMCVCVGLSMHVYVVTSVLLLLLVHFAQSQPREHVCSHWCSLCAIISFMCALILASLSLSAFRVTWICMYVCERVCSMHACRRSNCSFCFSSSSSFMTVCVSSRYYRNQFQF